MNTLMTLTLLTHAALGQPHGLGDDEFEKFHAQLRPPAEEGWSSIAWKTSLAQACVQAAREKKPLFMVVRSGHPLGCV